MAYSRQGSSIFSGNGNAPHEFNIHLVYVYKIAVQIDSYILGRYEEDFNTMYTALDLINTLSIGECDLKDPEQIEKLEKLDKDIENKLNWILENKDKWCYRNEKGEIIRVHDKNKERIKNNLNICFKWTLQKLDLLGILRKLKIDPSRAMAQFDA